MTVKRFSELDIPALLAPEGFNCSCGKRHGATPLRLLRIGPGALDALPVALRDCGVKRPFVVTGERTYPVAGARALARLGEAGMACSAVRLPGSPKVLPDDESVSRLEAAFDPACDFILGVGSGVINDLCKLLASTRGLDCGIAATAPSMDGYASNSSAMELRGIKTTVYTTCPEIIICDTDILRAAPAEALSAGFGDMAAKLVSVADWRIARLVTGEYYCPEIAALMERACAQVTGDARGILAREEPAIRRMTEGLVLSGLAMSFAGVSRPASGMEHTVSHLLEMFALSAGRQPAAHGLQVGYGVRQALRLYKRAQDFEPSEQKCVEAAERFDEGRWETELRRVFGAQAEELIGRALAEGRNSRENTLRRGLAAVRAWPEIKKIVSAVAGQAERVNAALDMMNIPPLDGCAALGCSAEEAENALRLSKDLRARYIFTSLCSDIGMPL